MATTENNFDGNGTQVSYPFTFEYLKTSDVKIGLKLGSGAEQVLAATEYTFPNATTLKLDTISSATNWQETSGAPKSGIKVRVHRKTADDNVASTFYPGSAIRSSDLNDNFLQNLYVTQEARNITGDSTTIADEAKELATTADANATTALNNSRESDGSGGWTTAIAKATSASNTATNASNAVGDKIDKDGSVAMTAALTLSGAPTSDLHASTKKYVDDYLIDEDNMSTNSASRLPSQQSVKAYVDAHIIDEDDFSSDSATKPPSQQSVKAYIGTTNYTKTEADARYFVNDDTETVDSTDTWSAGNTKIATTEAIDNRIIALVDDVGGFVPIASENHFPNTNPDINDPATGGTIVSIAELSENIVTGSGVTSNNSIAQTIGGTAVTINGLTQNTTYAQGFGMLVETTSTLNTYTFHRLVPKATEVTTVAGKATEITTCHTNITDINTVANATYKAKVETVADSTYKGKVETVAGASSDVTTVADNITDVSSFADLYQIATSAPSTDGGGNALASGDLWFDSSSNKTLKVHDGTSFAAVSPSQSVLDDISIVSGSLTRTEDLGSVADAIASDSSTGALDTCATNITNINAFANTYFINSSAPTGDNVGAGDLWYDSSNNILKYNNGSSWASISAGIANLLDDQTPELYAALDCNNKNLTEVATVSGDNLQIDFGAIA